MKQSLLYAYFVLFVALSISATAGYYSIVGLMVIFSGSAIAVAVMGTVLEIGKLVTASWLYRNWKTSPFFLKSYLSIAVIVLMFITSMGIFGFLSKAHLEKVGPSANLQAKIEQINFGIQQEQEKIEAAQKVLRQFDEALELYFEKDYITRGLKERKKQEEEREELEAEIKEANKEINNLMDEKFALKKEIIGIEAEVGPIKYIAELIYGDEAEKQIDKAVRMMIMILIFVFDPLAVLLVIAGNISLLSLQQQKNNKSNNVVPKKNIKKQSIKFKSNIKPEKIKNVKKPKQTLKNNNNIENDKVVPLSDEAYKKIKEIYSSDHEQLKKENLESDKKLEKKYNKAIDTSFEEAAKHANMPFNFSRNELSLLKKLLLKNIKNDKK